MNLVKKLRSKSVKWDKNADFGKGCKSLTNAQHLSY